MCRTVISIFLIVLLCTNFPISARSKKQAQTPAPQSKSAEQEQSKLVIPEGTLLQLSMREPVSSKLSEVGDEVFATLRKDVVVEGVTLLEEGTVVIGRVTIVKPAKRMLRGGLLHLSFDRIRLDNGLEHKLVTIVQSASDFDQNEKVSSNGEGTLKGSKNGESAARNAAVAAGIGFGAASIVIASRGVSDLLRYGRLGGGTIATSAIVLGGAVVVGVLLTKGKDVRIEPGSIVRLKLERPLLVE